MTKEVYMCQIYDKLYSKYNKSVISKSELAEEFGVSVRTIDRRIKEKNIVQPLDLSDDKRLEWSLRDIAIYLGDNKE
jgi:predicted DNA-binding transcriptional regulator YafY